MIHCSIDIAWLAGLLEGEGSFMAVPSRKHITPAINFTSTDEDVAHQVGKFMNRPVKGPYKYGANKKFYWTVTTMAQHQVAGWMMTLYTFMGKRRKAKIRELLEIWKNKPTYPQMARKVLTYQGGVA